MRTWPERSGTNSSTARVRVLYSLSTLSSRPFEGLDHPTPGFFFRGLAMFQFAETPFQLLDSVPQRRDGVRGGVEHVDLRPIRNDTNRFTVLRDDTRRNADYRCVRRHVLNDDRAAADFGVIADEDRAEDARVHADRHVTAQRRVTLTVREAGASERHSLIDGAVVADLRRLPNHDAHPMVDEDALADRCVGVNLDAGQETRH